MLMSYSLHFSCKENSHLVAILLNICSYLTEIMEIEKIGILKVISDI